MLTSRPREDATERRDLLLSRTDLQGEARDHRTCATTGRTADAGPGERLADLSRAYTFWRRAVTRPLPLLRRVVPFERIVLARRRLATLIGLAMAATLRVHRALAHACERPGVPR